jgi:hypothetical protein
LNWIRIERRFESLEPEVAWRNLDLKEMLTVVRLNSHGAETHRVSMPIDVLLPTRQAQGERAIV